MVCRGSSEMCEGGLEECMQYAHLRKNSKKKNSHLFAWLCHTPAPAPSPQPQQQQMTTKRVLQPWNGHVSG